MFDLVSVESVQFVTFHRPHVKCCVCLATCRNDEVFALGNKNSRSIAFQNVSEEPFAFLEIYTLLSNEFVVNDGLVESQSNIVVLGANADSSWCVVIERYEIFL